MVRLRCEKCNNDAAVVSLVGYTETYLCAKCEGRTRRPVATTGMPYRQLAKVVKSEAQSDPLVCGVCKISPARVFSPDDAQVYCWRCNEQVEKQGNAAPRYLVFGIQLKGTAAPETDVYCGDPQLFCQYWNLESDSDSILIESPQGAIPTVSFNQNIISNGSIKSLATSKSNDTNETLGMLVNECPSDSDAVDGVMPEGVVEGFPCGTIPVCELPGFKRNRMQANGKFKKRRCIKSREPLSSPTQRRCMMCGVLKTPQWRAGPSGQKTLCNACGVKAARGAASGRGRGRGRARKQCSH